MKKDKSYLKRLLSLDSNTISDALDFLNLKGATFELRALWKGPKIVGRASTIQLGKKITTDPTVHLISPVIDAIVNDDRILVISGGLPGVSCWGDILANAAKQKKIRGTIIDGYSRDIDGSESIVYPVFGRGITMISARNRMVQLHSGKKIQVAGVTVHENDYVIADSCGSVFIPQKHIEEVLILAENIEKSQLSMLDAVRSGISVTRVMHDNVFLAIHNKKKERKSNNESTF
jgi:regulator of RNase E activity RraA